MPLIPADRIDPERLKQVLAGDPPVLAVSLPDQISSAIGIDSPSSMDRDQWRVWINRVPDARTIYLWIAPRREDDQEFMDCLAKALHPAARLHTFHSMAMMTVDRLTGDAVQSLLHASGLSDVGCGNTGFGYYTRRFIRPPEAGPPTLPDWWRPPEPERKPEPPKPKPARVRAVKPAGKSAPAPKKAAAKKTSVKKAPAKKPPPKVTAKSKPVAKKTTAKPTKGSKRK